MAAKMDRRTRGWHLMSQDVEEGKKKQRGYSKKAKIKSPRAYDALLATTQVLGIKVRSMTQAELAQMHTGADGGQFQAKGFFLAPNVIALKDSYFTGPSYSTLLHEMAHAIDYQLGEDRSDRSWLGGFNQIIANREAIAIGVEYLITVMQLGAGHASLNLRYMQSSLVDMTVLDRNHERIDVITELILEALADQAA